MHACANIKCLHYNSLFRDVNIMRTKSKTTFYVFLMSFIILTSFFCFANFASAARPPIFEREEFNRAGEYVPDEILVKFTPGTSDDVISEINSRHGTFEKYTSPYGKFKVIGIPAGRTVSEMVEIYNENPHVEYAEPNYIAYALMMPNDPYYVYQWNLDNSGYGGINVEAAWDFSTGIGVTVAVIDTGVAYENYGRRYKQAPDLANTLFVAGYDFVNNDAHPNDDNSHGTHVAGTIAQSTDNGIGVAGVAFNAYIMPIKVLNKAGSGTYDWVTEGIYYAVDHGANVISMSLGGPSPSTTLEDALAYAYNSGVTVVAAAGNDGKNVLNYPAAYDDYVIAVGATRYDETLAYYSNYGSSLDLVAPGGDLTVDQNGDGYGDGVLQNTFNPNTKNTRDFAYWFFQGTSMATPHIAGVAALVIANGVTGPDNVRAALETTAEDLGTTGFDETYGWGLVDAYTALQWTATPNNPPVADDQSVTTNEDESISITLTATDPDDDPLTFSIVSEPSHGVLTEIATGVTYTPNANYNGEDSFTFKANDGKADSNIATVSVTVNAVNDKPVASSQSVTTEQDTAKNIILTGSDVDGDTLTYAIASQPTNGILTEDVNFGTHGIVTYTPYSGFVGDDSFTFTVSDSQLISDPAQISITVTKVNYPPVADDQSVTTNEDESISITLTATDTDNDPLTYTIITMPTSGELTGNAPDLTYTPNPNFYGSDTLTFKANDGQADSNPATVSITVNAVNDAPVANAGLDQTVPDADGNEVETVTLDGSASYDPDGSISLYEWIEGTTVLGTEAVISYDFSVGTYTVTLTVTDNEGVSASDQTVITVIANEAPVADAGPDQSAYVGDTVNFDGSGSYDPDGEIVSYEWDFGDGGTASGAIVSHIYETAGTYVAILTVTDNGDLTDSDDVVVIVEEAPAGPTMHVEDITITTDVRDLRRWFFARATVTVTIVDASGTPVEGATVYGSWSNLYNADVSGVTNADGKVSFTTGWARSHGIFTFSVNNVVKTDWIYDQSANKETSDSETV